MEITTIRLYDRETTSPFPIPLWERRHKDYLTQHDIPYKERRQKDLGPYDPQYHWDWIDERQYEE